MQSQTKRPPETITRPAEKKVLSMQTCGIPDDVAPAVLAVVGPELEDTFDDLDTHPSSLDLPLQKKMVKTEIAPSAEVVLFKGRTACAILAVIGAEADDNFADVSDAPASLDLRFTRKK